MKFVSCLTNVLMLCGLFLHAGCGVSRPVESVTFLRADTLISGLDFRDFASRGFLFTTESYSGDYAAIGLIDIEIYPTASRSVETVKSRGGGEIRGGAVTTEYGVWEQEYVRAQGLLDIAYDRAVLMGANAIINLEFEVVSKDDLVGLRKYPGGQEADWYTRTGIRMSGFAIKRK